MRLKNKLIHILLVSLLSTLTKAQSIDTSRYLFEAFDQGNDAMAGNCASIALIKASIACFGLNGIYEETKLGDDLLIKLKNGTQLTVTREELLIARDNCFFDTSSYKSSSTSLAKLRVDIYRRAYTTYAVMIKWVMLNGDGNSTVGNGCKDSCNYKSFNSALCDLATGINSHHLYYLLGLEDYTTCTKNKQQLKDKAFGVVWRGGHTIYSSNELYDYYNKSRSLPVKWYPFFKNGFYLNKTKTINRGSFQPFNKCN
jgi:hypothetical protein